MGIRRRRKKLTSLISNMDKRIRTVEFKKTAYGVASTTEEVSANEEENGNEPEGSVYSATLPNPWTRVKRAYFHPSNVVAGDRFELLFYNTEGIESVSGSSVERGDYVSISALGRSAAPIVTVGRTYFKNTNASNPYYTCRAHGTPSWTLSATNTRETLKFNGNQVYVPLPISGDTFGTVTHTYLFSHNTSLTGNSPRYSLATRALIASHSATTTTATLTISGTSHHYTEDDIIDVNDLPEAYRGVDGLFKVTSVTSTTISYDFDTPLSASISSATASSGTYIYSVAQKYVRVGSTWFDTANDNKVYYWNGIRYQVGQVAGLSNDGSAPNPPTNLTLTTSGYNRPDGTSRSRVDLSWTAPTTSANGNTLDDLLGYKIRISETGYSNWRDTRDLIGPDTSETITNLDQNKEYFFRVTAYDSFGNESTGLDDSVVTGVAALALDKLSAPTIPTPRLGVVAVSWDGKTYSGGVVAQDMVKFVEVHASTTSGYTPSESTLVGKIYRAKDPCNVSGLTYNATYYFKLVAVDTNGNSTTPSEQTSAIITPLVDTDIIGKILDGANIKNGSVTASDVIIGNTITGGLIQALAITAGKIDTNAITADKINAGAITAVKIDTGAIEASKILVTDTFAYRNSAYTLGLSYGQNAVDGQLGTAGISFENGSGTSFGWLGSWLNGAIELGTNFTLNYIDLYDNNTMFIRAEDNFSLQGGTGALNMSTDSTTLYSDTDLDLGTFNNSYSVNIVGPLRNLYGYQRTPATTVPNMVISSQGLIYRTTHVNSSLRYKTDVVPLEFDMDKYLSLMPVLYKYKPEIVSEEDSKKIFSGFIAEELDAAGFTDLIDYDDKGRPDALKYDRLTAYLHSVVQNQEARIKELETKIGMP